MAKNDCPCDVVLAGEPGEDRQAVHAELQYLQGHAPAHRHFLLGEIHLAKAPAPEFGQDAVGPDLADPWLSRERHVEALQEPANCLVVTRVLREQLRQPRAPGLLVGAAKADRFQFRDQLRRQDPGHAGGCWCRWFHGMSDACVT